jgi:pimeloyl-ACP methyl ester carboxylesterase
VLVGHSCGGAVITQASAGLDNVIGLVYLAAWGREQTDGKDMASAAWESPDDSRGLFARASAWSRTARFPRIQSIKATREGDMQ